MVTTVWLILGSEYLHLETWPGIWLVSGFVLLAIPVFLIWPLLACTLQIQRARAARVRPFEDALDGALSTLEAQAAGRRGDLPQLSESLEKFATAREAIASIFPVNPVPFKPRLVGTLSAGYLFQLALFAKKIVEALR
jgi:hypothetical protein